ncbi:inversion kinesin InvA [Volvox carteri f. nagariensis]|uniref:Kinesin-like protein n=1 Tax=Volvox carteri f. nagariensis TaxID=3068 RepID=D8TPJ9_VOLCA|nr:inversion kinesin InvA [Volvox carteri f. nagariensis]EFJ50779.1 inversion kinesin InvA [Volvox carteri f. nagariensis]|eukprot:XP_002948372.1 inversion kinesin InvA [Volvox carteri f. nagariensis]
MAEQEGGEPSSAIQVCVRVRPLNPRERDEGLRACVSFDEETKQVVLSAVDKNTLLQLRGATAKGYAFDRRYGQDITSDAIYEDCVAQLVEAVFKTGSGKTHTMAGGQGIHGVVEEGITPRVIRHIFALAEAIRKKEKPGEKTQVEAYGLELYNEDLRDLALAGGRDETAKGWDGKGGNPSALKLQERPVGKDGRVVPEVIGVTERVVSNADELLSFFNLCMENRSTSSTKLNDRSSRSHAIFTITVQRTIVEVLNELGADLKAKVRTSEFTSKLHLVDLAGSERVKRSGVTGKELKEATHINSGLLALGNVIVALAGDEKDGTGKAGAGEKKKATHVPYRDSKLTRLLQDSLGGNSLTVLISCISPSESDFEETNNTLKYANRACKIKNQPLPNRFTTLEEDLLPVIPQAGMGASLGMMQLQALLEDHEKLKEVRERRERERKEKEAKRAAALSALREEQMKAKGFQRLRATQYDELRRRLAGGAAASIPTDQVIGDELLKGFGTRLRISNQMTNSVDSLGGAGSAGPASARRPHLARPASSRNRVPPTTDESPSGTPSTSRPRPGTSTAKAVGKSSFAAWLASQEAGTGGEGGEGVGSTAGSEYGGTDDFVDGDGTEDYAGGEHGDESMFADEDPSADGAGGDANGGDDSMFAEEDPSAGKGEEGSAPAASKSKFRRAQKQGVDGAGGPAAVGGSEVSLTELEQGAGTSGNVDGVDPADSGGVDEGAGADDGGGYDLLDEGEVPKLLARFKVNQHDTLAVFKACTKEDFKDVISLLPENTPLPASDKMTYLLARLEVNPGRDMAAALLTVATGEATMKEAVGPAVGCLMATFGTNMIASCIFDFDDPDDLRYYGVDERIELWGLQIPHTSVRPALAEGLTEEQALAAAEASKDNTITWSSVDRLNMSIGLLYALCNHAIENGIRCGFCVPRPQLLKRWMQAGVKMEQTAHDYEYYRASTVAWFMVAEVKAKLERVLGIVH